MHREPLWPEAGAGLQTDEAGAEHAVPAYQEGSKAAIAAAFERVGAGAPEVGLPAPARPSEARGIKLGVNQTYRWYRLEQLQLRSWRKKRSKTTTPRQARMQPIRINDAWSMDFVADQLADGTKIRLLTIIDIHSRESLAIVVGHHLRGEDVVAALNHIVSRRPAPKCLFVDNGSKFSGQLLDLWAYHHQAKIDFSRLGKPTDNCFIETFNGSLRDECLNIHWFASLAEARTVVEA